MSSIEGFSPLPSAHESSTSSSSAEGWIVHGVIEKSSRQKIREHVDGPLDDGVEAIHMFRCSSLPEQLADLVSPLKPVKTPTLLELKEYKDLRLVKERLDDVEQWLDKYKDQLEEGRIARIKVQCVGFIHELLNRMASLLVCHLGKTLTKVSEQERKKLMNGPFKKWQNFDRKCGTYLDLVMYYNMSSDPYFEAVLMRVEYETIKSVKEVDHFREDPKQLRMLLATSFVTARNDRDRESHVGMLKDKEKRNMAIRKIKEEIEETQLSSVGMTDLVPLVNAGIFTMVTLPALKEDEEDPAGSKEEIKDEQHQADQQKKVKKGVKVTFRVKKRCELGSIVHIVGFHKKLGSGNTSKAIPMSSHDGETWWTQITFLSDERISYRYVVRCLGQDCEFSDIHESDIESGPTFENVEETVTAKATQARLAHSLSIL